MGFHRLGQPQALDRAAATAAISRMLAEEMAGPVPTSTPPDPFNIDTDCVSPSGHAPIVSCGDLVCRRCSKVLWL